MPKFTFPAFTDPNAWAAVTGIALIAIATIPESTAHLYQMSLYIDQLAKELGRAPLEIKRLIGLNLVADGSDDIVVGFLGGCAGTNYGENNSLMAITRCYSVPVLMTAGVMAILLGFVGKLAAVVNTLPAAVVGGLSIYLFGVIGMQGIALIQSEKVNLFEPRQLAVGAIILVTGIGGNLALPNGMFPFPIPVLFPDGIPAIVFCGDPGHPGQPDLPDLATQHVWRARPRKYQPVNHEPRKRWNVGRSPLQRPNISSKTRCEICLLMHTQNFLNLTISGLPPWQRQAGF